MNQRVSPYAWFVGVALGLVVIHPDIRAGVTVLLAVIALALVNTL